jgi:hypothetical protein
LSFLCCCSFFNWLQCLLSTIVTIVPLISVRLVPSTPMG